MVAVVLALLSMAWLVLLIAAPAAPTALATIVYAIGSFICHQRPERSFHIEAAQLPVCARCLGVYAGAAVGTLSRIVPGLDPPLGARAALLLGVVPTIVTIALEWTVGDPGNVVRGAAGVPIGVAAAFVLVPRVRLH